MDVFEWPQIFNTFVGGLLSALTTMYFLRKGWKREAELRSADLKHQYMLGAQRVISEVTRIKNYASGILTLQSQAEKSPTKPDHKNLIFSCDSFVRMPNTIDLRSRFDANDYNYFYQNNLVSLTLKIEELLILSNQLRYLVEAYNVDKKEYEEFVRDTGLVILNGVRQKDGVDDADIKKLMFRAIHLDQMIGQIIDLAKIADDKAGTLGQEMRRIEGFHYIESLNTEVTQC